MITSETQRDRIRSQVVVKGQQKFDTDPFDGDIVGP